MASRWRVKFFSLASSSFRAAIHSSRDTTLGLSTVLLLATPLLMTLSPFFVSTRLCQPPPSSSRESWRETYLPEPRPSLPLRQCPPPSLPKPLNMPDTSKPPSRYSPLLTAALKGASFTTPDSTNCVKAFWSAAVLFPLSLEGLPLSRCTTLVRPIH